MWPLRAANGTSRSAARTARTRSARLGKVEHHLGGCPQAEPHDDAALDRTAAVDGDAQYHVVAEIANG